MGRLDYIDQIRDLLYHAKSGKAKLDQLAEVSLDRAYTMTGGLLALRADQLRAVGGYDPSFRRCACDDIYVQVRLLNAGHVFRYDPAITAYHLHQHASVREFLWRAYSGIPRGLARLLQRCAEYGLRMPFEGYVMHVPVHTTGLLILGIVAAAAGWPFGVALLAAGLVAQSVEVRPLFTTRRGDYPVAVRLGAVATYERKGALAASVAHPHRSPDRGCGCRSPKACGQARRPARGHRRRHRRRLPEAPVRSAEGHIRELS
ncbi:glycosyltransferase family 2 protein [Dactylosporangium sp. CA-233914]|uniref:glycosyltransferase family 2 protein n=1 Tax=Dactylosporangium sp. CA-233914 TaxID=3239934 RepID=UPI003D8A7621